MTVRFPDPPQCLDHVNQLSDHSEVQGDSQYNFSHLIDAEIKCKFLRRVWQPRGVAIDPKTNRIYTVEGVHDKSSVYIFSEAGEFLKNFLLKQMKEPWGIATHKGSAYITDTLGHSISHFDMSADFRLVGKVERKGSRLGRFNEPKQLTVSPIGEIFVADKNNHRIQIFDRNLEIRRSISHDTMTEPRDVKLTLNEVYVLCPRDHPWIHVFSHAGELICPLIKGDPFYIQLRFPTFFCVDLDGNFVVSGWGVNQVKVFSNDGTLLRILEHHRGFRKLNGIAITKSNKLVVACESYGLGLNIYYY